MVLMMKVVVFELSLGLCDDERLESWNQQTIREYYVRTYDLNLDVTSVLFVTSAFCVSISGFRMKRRDEASERKDEKRNVTTSACDIDATKI